MDWFQQRDSELSDKFMELDTTEPATLIADIIGFCSVCDAALTRITNHRRRYVAAEAAFYRKKWLCRLAFFSKPIPKLFVTSLPLEFLAELARLDSAPSEHGRRVRRYFTDSNVQACAYRILMSGSDAPEAASEILGLLSNPQSFSLAGSFIEVGLAGFTSFDAAQRPAWIWEIRICISDQMDVHLRITEEELSGEIQGWLFRLVHADEAGEDSTREVLQAA